MRLTLILLFACTAALSAAHCNPTVWVAGHWDSGQRWVQGSYVSQPVVVRQQTVVVQQPTQVVVQSRPPAPVWVDGGWVWSNNQWVWREGYWSGAPACPPQPVCQPQPVYIQQQQVVYEPVTRPVVSVGVGIGVGYGYNNGGDCRPSGRHHSGHGSRNSRVSVPPIPFLPGSHALPRPPKNFPDPLGVFRHDPLGWIKKK